MFQLVKSRQDELYILTDNDVLNKTLKKDQIGS